jgi:diaminopropionate ammonia-lyase
MFMYYSQLIGVSCVVCGRYKSLLADKINHRFTSLRLENMPDKKILLNNSFNFNPNVETPKAMLKAYPTYSESPLKLISYDKKNAMLIKDETQRMDMGSFKATGGIYAVGQLILRRWSSMYRKELCVEDLHSSSVKQFASNITFVCASAGNHGLAVAAGANIFGAKSKIYLSSSVPPSFGLELEKYGAEVVYAGETYEQSCQAAIEEAQSTDSILLADSAWDGYIEPPMLIMEGYTIIAEELRESFEISNNWPTHVFIQAGVGGLVGSISFMIRKNWAKQPKIIVVEPEYAACLLDSAKYATPTTVTGPLSNMGRLDCKDPSLIALNILAKIDVEYLTVCDDEADDATEKLAEMEIHTTPSGAAGFAGLRKYHLPINAQPLIIITEGVLA